MHFMTGVMMLHIHLYHQRVKCSDLREGTFEAERGRDEGLRKQLFSVTQGSVDTPFQLSPSSLPPLTLDLVLRRSSPPIPHQMFTGWGLLNNQSTLWVATVSRMALWLALSFPSNQEKSFYGCQKL